MILTHQPIPAIARQLQKRGDNVKGRQRAMVIAGNTANKLLYHHYRHTRSSAQLYLITLNQPTDMINLFSNEKIITASNGDEITLTNYRVNYNFSGESIELFVPQWNYEETIRFMDNVQLAKAQRVFGLYKEDVGSAKVVYD